MKTTAVQVEGFLVAAAFFPMLGVEPALGRGFTDEDAQPGRDTVVLLSHGFWRRQFAADPTIVGQSVDVDGTLCTVVGVLPSSFKIYRVLNRELDLFRPLVLDATDREQSLNVYAKLKPTVSLDSARAQMTTAYASLPVPNQLWTADAALLSTSFTAQSRSILLVLQCAVALVLLIACANIANLLLAVSTGRRKELAVRQALGASGWRIARDLAGETLILALAGGALAILSLNNVDAGYRASAHQRAAAKRGAVEALARYLTTNRDRMRYQTFRQAGYHIGSGAVESAVSYVVQQRMKRVGMRWRAAGADAMLALPSIYRSTGAWNAFWGWRRAA